MKQTWDAFQLPYVLAWNLMRFVVLFCHCCLGIRSTLLLCSVCLTPAQVTVYECSDAGSMVPVRAYADAEVS